MKKTFRIIVSGIAAILFGMAVYSAQAQVMVGAAVPTDRGGCPIYANQEGYYGLNGGCASGNCGNHAVGPMVGGYAGMAAPCGAPCAEPCGVPCAAPCEAPCAAPCPPVYPVSCGPCLPCGPCFAGGCGPCGGGLIGRIWNGQNYWQGPGCSERVIDELRKSWYPCACCDVTGEPCCSPHTIGSGLRSSQIVTGAPVKMNAGQPEKGFYTAPSPYCGSQVPFQGAAPMPAQGGCKSCQGGMHFTAVQPQQTQQVVYGQTVSQPVQQTYAQPVQQNYVQPVQYQEPVRETKNFRTSGAIHYRSNYTPSSEVPGYLKAQMNAEKDGIGFETAKTAQTGKVESAWRPVSYNQVSDSLETVATPAPRAEGSVLAAAPVQTGAMVYPAGVPMGDCGAPCGDCGVPCGDCCAPCGDCCTPCGGCGPCWGPWWGAGRYGGMWPGLIPLVGDTVRFTGRVAYRTGRAAVIGTGIVARGSLRTVGAVFWNPNVMGPIVPGPGVPVAAAAPIDPVYAENDMYLNASSVSGRPTALQASNLYENNYYPQNYAVISDTVVSPAVPSVPAAVPAVPANTVVAAPAAASPSASLLSYQTQRVMLEDGTEVILEHDAMAPQNRALNASAQYMAANDSAAPALSSAAPGVVPVSMNAPIASNVVMKPADTSASAVPMSQAAYGSAVQMVPAPATAVSADGYPIVASEQPQIQLAPGEVLVSQQDYILEPAGTPSAGESNGLVPVDENVPLEKIESNEENSPAAEPVRDAKVTKVSFEQPVEPKVTIIPASVPSEERETSSGWKVRVNSGSDSLLGLKSATPIK